MVCDGYWDDPEETANIRRNGWHLATEVERVLRSLPGIADAAVLGVPDERWGEAVNAYVETTGDHGSSEGEIINAVKAGIGSVKAPKSVEFVDALPKPRRES